MPAPALPALPASTADAACAPAHVACVALGSNLGDRLGLLRRATAAIAAQVGTLEAVSAVYETPPLYITDQPPFLNAAARVRTALGPLALLEALLSIERGLGRDRGGAHGLRFGPRPIDLDLLLYDGLTLSHDALTLPHPRLHERRFVLAPLAEVAPDGWRHPTTAQSLPDLLAACPDRSPLARLSDALTP